MKEAIFLMPAQLSQLDLSKRLRELMLEHELSVAQLAEIGGVSKSAMEKYLSGPSSPRAITLVNICMALSVSPSWLLLGKAEADDVNKAVAFISSVFDEMRILLRNIRSDPKEFERFIAADPTSEAWADFNRSIPYVAAKKAYARFEALKDSVDTLPGIEIKAD